MQVMWRRSSAPGERPEPADIRNREVCVQLADALVLVGRSDGTWDEVPFGAIPAPLLRVFTDGVNLVEPRDRPRRAPPPPPKRRSVLLRWLGWAA